jgi:hypothetical protein
VIGAAARPAVRAWLAPRARAFARDLGDPVAAQRRVAEAVVADLARTEYGRAHGVRTDGDALGALRRLPVATWEALEPWVARQMATEAAVLTAEPVLFYERTSGSAGPAKAVPCTPALRRAFTTLFLLWLHDLLGAGPALRTGRAWISATPPARPRERTGHDVALGVDTDLDYLAGWPRRLLRPFLALPPEAARLEDPDGFAYVAAFTLLAGRAEVVSAWNPSLLTVLLDTALARRDDILRDWCTGAAVRGGLRVVVPRARPSALGALARDPVDWPAVLPDLRLVSCWADGPARAEADRLRRRLPGVPVQGKGLLATEAPVTLPLAAAGGCVPLVSEVVLEFVDDAGALGGLDDVAVGREYALVVTPRGGLPRYRLGDRVRVTHRHLATPCLEFVGREGTVSDLAGEKLAEPFVEAALARLPLEGAFRSLVPVAGGAGAGHYVLLVDRAAADAGDLARRLDAELGQAVRYAQARRLGQLAAPRVRVLPDAAARFLACRSAQGARRGAVKPATLVVEADLARRLLDA